MKAVLVDFDDSLFVSDELLADGLTDEEADELVVKYNRENVKKRKKRAVKKSDAYKLYSYDESRGLLLKN